MPNRRKQNLLAGLPVVLGLFAVGCIPFGLWDAGGWAGLVGALVAAYVEFVAQTSVERLVILTGFALCVVGVAVAMAHGAVL